MTLAEQTWNLLGNLRGYDDLLELLQTLGFTYTGDEWSTADWPEAIRDAVIDIRIAARHGNFLVFYVQVREDRMLTW